MASIRRKIGAVIASSFVLFGDKILSWYMSLRLWETWSGAAVVGIVVFGFVRLIHKYPDKIRPHADAIRKVLGDIKFTVFAFVFAGISNVFFNLDKSLISFYMYPGPWIVFGLQAAFLINLAGLEYDELNFAARLATIIWKLGRNLYWQLRHRPRKMTAATTSPKVFNRIERIVAFLAGAIYLGVTLGPLLLDIPMPYCRGSPHLRFCRGTFCCS